MAGPTVIPTISPAQFAQRLAALFPNGWASPDAAQGGVLYALLLAFGQQLNAVLEQVRYADNAVLVETEMAPELDFASQDYFGAGLPRAPGQTDAAFSNEILANIFSSAATRPALANALFRLTGQMPRMLEPWNPGDTGAWDCFQTSIPPPPIGIDGTTLLIQADGGGILLADSSSAVYHAVCFWDVDSAVNPWRWTGEERATGFIETVTPPNTSNINGNPVLCWDDGWFWDVPGSAFYDLNLNPAGSVYALINRLKALGVTVGVKILA